MSPILILKSSVNNLPFALCDLLPLGNGSYSSLFALSALSCLGLRSYRAPEVICSWPFRQVAEHSLIGCSLVSRDRNTPVCLLAQMSCVDSCPSTLVPRALIVRAVLVTLSPFLLLRLEDFVEPLIISGVGDGVSFTAR